MRKTYYPCNVCGKRFNTATKRTTHEMNIKNSKVKADFGRFKIITINIQPDRVLHAFWLKGGPMPPLGFAKGGHFEVKDGHPDFLQIT